MTNKLIDYGNGILRCPNICNSDLAILLSEYLKENSNRRIVQVTDGDFYGRIIITEERRE